MTNPYRVINYLFVAKYLVLSVVLAMVGGPGSFLVYSLGIVGGMFWAASHLKSVSYAKNKRV